MRLEGSEERLDLTWAKMDQRDELDKRKQLTEKTENILLTYFTGTGFFSQYGSFLAGDQFFPSTTNDALTVIGDFCAFISLSNQKMSQ
jgi:hypothetical protein